MATNAGVIVLLLMACLAAVTRTTTQSNCDTKCQLRSLAHLAGKRTKSVDRNTGSLPWNQGDTLPTYTADVKTKDPNSRCIFDEAFKTISPKWQERLLSVLEGALMETEEDNDDSFEL